MKNAIVVGGGGFQGLSVLRSLRALKWCVIIADSIPESLNRFEADIFYVMPEVKYAEDFRNSLIALINKYSVKALFPTTMYDLPILSRLRVELETLGIKVFSSKPSLVDLLSDKLQTTLAAQSAGLPILPPEDPMQHDFSYPLLGKPIRGWGGTGLLRLAHRQQYCENVQEEKEREYLWQRELSCFTEWSVDFALGEKGDCSPVVCRRRLRTTGGFAVVSEIDNHPELEQLVAATVNWLIKNGGYGLFNVQFLEELDSSIWLSDINPRPGTSSVCALAAGVNLVDFLLHGNRNFKPARSGYVVRTLHESFIPKFNQQIKGIVFDLDETLICQKRWMHEKLKITLEEIKKNIGHASVKLFQEEALRLIDEGPWNKLIDIALYRAGLPSNLSEILISMWHNAHPDNLFLHQDAEVFFQKLLDLGIPTALITDNPANSQWQKIERLPKYFKFKSIILTEEISSPKPAARGFLDVADRLSLNPDDLLMIGDSVWRDGLGAMRAGYAGALIVQRNGSMHNSLKNLFENEYPEYSNKIIWTDSLLKAQWIFNYAR